MVGGLALKAAGEAHAEPLVALGSMVVAVAMLVFTIDVLVNGGAESRSGEA